MSKVIVLFVFLVFFILIIQAQVVDSPMLISKTEIIIDSSIIHDSVRFISDSNSLKSNNIKKGDSSNITLKISKVPQKNLITYISSWFDNFIHPKLQDTLIVIPDQIYSDYKTPIIQKQIDNKKFVIATDTVIITQKIDTVKRSFFSIFKYWNNDSLHTPALLLRPYVENGMLSLINDSIKSLYSTKTIFSYGFGFQIGHIRNHSIIPYTQFSFAKTAFNKNTLYLKHISIGLYYPIYRVNDSYLALKIGYCLVLLKESKNAIHQNIPGFQAGIVLDHKLGGNARIYIGYSYYYEKSPTKNFKDFDATKLTFGIIL